MSKQTNEEDIKVDEHVMTKILNWAYDAAIDGIPGLGNAEDLANDFLKSNKPLDKKINSLIRWQNTKCATSGFITGLGGVITLPVALPANITSVIYVQIRMIAAIAYMSGYDIHDDRIRTLVYVCLAGDAANNIVKNAGIQTGSKFATSFIEKKITGEALKKINQRVGFRLVTKFGEKGVINLGKMVPVVGGVIGGSLDALSTNTIGKVAKKIFEPELKQNGLCLISRMVKS